MSNQNIIKVCAKHGPLTVEQTHKDKNRKGEIAYRCAQCRCDSAKRSASKYKERINACSKRWRDNNPERRRELGNYFRKKYISEMNEGYVAEKLKRKFGYDITKDHPELIDVQKALLVVHRAKKNDS